MKYDKHNLTIKDLKSEDYNMKVKLKGEYHDTTNPLHFVLNNRGVNEEDYDKYIKPTDKIMPDWKLVENKELGFNLLNSHVDSTSKIGIQVDPYMDGMSSAAITYKFLIQQLNNTEDNVVLIPPKGKMHGIIVNRVVVHGLKKGNLLIVPDAGSSDFEQHKELFDLGINTLVIDHHLAPIEETPAIIINNQLSPEFMSKALTGLAMVYLFCVGYCEYFNRNLTVNLEDLSSIGLVAI